MKNSAGLLTRARQGLSPSRIRGELRSRARLVFNLLNVPTKDEVIDLEERLDELEEIATELHARLVAISRTTKGQQ